MAVQQRSAEGHTEGRRSFSVWPCIGFLVLAGTLWGVYALAGQRGTAMPRETPAETAGRSPQAPTGAGGLRLAQADADGAGPGGKPEPSPKQVSNPFPRRVQAPSLDGGVGWLNSSGPITLRDLRGKVVLLDFWTYCCINCMHVLPDLEYLEEKYADQLVVIGVHSAKFENEKKTENIRRAILRYEIKHPVINDANRVLWRKFRVNSWPSFRLIDPEGFLVGGVSGEGRRELLDLAIGKLVAYHRRKGTLDETPVRFDLENEDVEPTPLKFPGKVLADEESNRLFIADSNHNRIVIATLDGRLLNVIGTGEIGAQDGSYGEAAFDHPQGMALVDQTLYVADTENHLIRTVDLESQAVSTLAGTGQQAGFRDRPERGALRTTPLASPWDVLHHDGMLYIAMAGPHQIWHHKLGTDRIAVYAGTGKEDILDDALKQAAFAQPSGLATDGVFLFVADSEGSAIRRLPMGRAGKVATLVGASDLPFGRSLFEFGDRDGVGNAARLQHPLGIAYRDETVYVADAYNHKIKKVTLDGDVGRASTWLGDGQPGDSLEPPRFSEPGGLSIAGNTVYIADTNNHRIVAVDLDTGRAEELTIPELTPPERSRSQNAETADSVKAMRIEPQEVAPADSLRFEIDIQLPDGYKINELAPLTYRLTAETGQSLIAPDQLEVRRTARNEGNRIHVKVPLAERKGKAVVDLALTYPFCRGGSSGLCKVETARWRVPVTLSPQAEQTAVQLTARAGSEP